MRLGFSWCFGLAFLLCGAAARADPRPVVIEYAAPPQCASSEAFEKLVQAQLARSSQTERPWRYAVHITEANGSYVGRVSTETATREVSGASCDEVAAALATIIVVATPNVEPAAPPPPAPPPLPPPPVNRAREGEVCRTTLDCEDGLRCSEGACTDVASWRPRETLGHAAMFGSGRGYGTMIAIADIMAAVTEPFLTLGAVSNPAPTMTYFGVAAFFPVSLASPIVHLAHGRVVPAIISLFAWSSAAGTTFVVAGACGLATAPFGEFNYAAAWTGGLAFGAAVAAGLTYLDVWMARPMKTEPPERANEWALRLTPSIAPTRGGAMASLGGSW